MLPEWADFIPRSGARVFIRKSFPYVSGTEFSSSFHSPPTSHVVLMWQVKRQGRKNERAEAACC